MERISKADVVPVRQQTQYTCMSCSVSMCFKALGLNLDEEAVNLVLKASPMQGASWEDALQTAQHFGVRATFTSPGTLELVKKSTDKGDPAIISWSPEGNPWSHASVIFDVKDGNVHIADPNMPNPNKTVRVVPEDEFYSKWVEKGTNFNFRRPVLILSREVTKDGKHVMASLEKSWGPMMPQTKLACTKSITTLWGESGNSIPGGLDTHNYAAMLKKQGASGLPGADNEPVHLREDGYDSGKKVDEGYNPGEVKKAGQICNRALQRLARVAFRETCRGLAQHPDIGSRWAGLQSGDHVCRILVETSKSILKLGSENPTMMNELKKKVAGLDGSKDPRSVLREEGTRIAEKLILDCKDELPELRAALEIKSSMSAAADFLKWEVVARTMGAVVGSLVWSDPT